MSVNASNHRALYYKALTALPALLGLALCAAFLIPCAHAQIIEDSIYYYTSSATINTDIRGNDVVIGKMPGGFFGNAAGDTDLGTTPASAYTVTVAAGANISYDSLGSSGGYSGLDVYNRNTLAITGGDVLFAVGRNASTINVSGGSIGSVDSQGASTINISGGNLNSVNAVVGRGTTVVNISGGNIMGRAVAEGFSVFNISGGSVASIMANGDNSVFNLTGGAISSHIVYRYGDNATVNFFGKSIIFSSAMTGTDPSGNPGVFYDVAWKQNSGNAVNTRYFDLGGDVNNAMVQGVTFNGAAVTVGGSAAAPEPGSLALLGLALPFIGIVSGRKGYRK